VTPKVLPDPFGLTVRELPLPDRVAFQLLWTLWLPLRVSVTVHALLPLTA
jgi:hypothetical protein